MQERSKFMPTKPNPELIDEVNPEWTRKRVRKAKPANEVLPQIFGTAAAEHMLRPRGRPRAKHPKELINIRLSHDVLEHFKASGDGWQTRIDAALKQFITQHPSSR
jgi:uncharacterized protein (DUF4415 family)